MLDGVGRPADAERVARKPLQLVREQSVVQGTVLHVSASLGITLYPHDGPDQATLEAPPSGSVTGTDHDERR